MVLWHSSSGSPLDESDVCFLYFFWFCCFWASTFFWRSFTSFCTLSSFFFRSSWPVSTFYFRSSTFFCKASRPASIFFFTCCLVWSETSPHPVADPTSTSTAGSPINTRTFVMFASSSPSSSSSRSGSEDARDAAPSIQGECSYLGAAGVGQPLDRIYGLRHRSQLGERPHRTRLHRTASYGGIQALGHAPEGQSPHAREGQDRPAAEQQHLHWLRWSVATG